VLAQQFVMNARVAGVFVLLLLDGGTVMMLESLIAFVDEVK
jgi:hypothetical protein